MNKHQKMDEIFSILLIGMLQIISSWITIDGKRSHTKDMVKFYRDTHH